MKKLLIAAVTAALVILVAGCSNEEPAPAGTTGNAGATSNAGVKTGGNQASTPPAESYVGE